MDLHKPVPVEAILYAIIFFAVVVIVGIIFVKRSKG